MRRVGQLADLLDGHHHVRQPEGANTFNGQPVNFLNYFNTQGALTVWGAPISNPAPDPNNNGFIYQRFQRGIMHYIQGTGTESILIADYSPSSATSAAWLSYRMAQALVCPPVKPRDVFGAPTPTRCQQRRSYRSSRRPSPTMRSHNRPAANLGQHAADLPRVDRFDVVALGQRQGLGHEINANYARSPNACRHLADGP